MRMFAMPHLPRARVPIPKFSLKIVYFNRNVIKTNWNAINNGPLKHAGLLVRKISRQSIRRRSSSGRPGRKLKGKALLAAQRLSVKRLANKYRRSGMSNSDSFRRAWRETKAATFRLYKDARKPSPPGTPPRSWQPGKLPPFKMIFSLPSNVSSQIVGMIGLGSTPPVPGLHEHGGSAVRRVPSMAGGSLKFIRRSVRYPMRPFMMPALLKAKSLLPQLWKDSIRS